MKTFLMAMLSLAMTFSWALVNLAKADIYKWVDKKGVVHFTDNPDELPEPQRSKVLKELEQQEKKRKKSLEANPGQQSQGYKPIPPEARQERIPPQKQADENAQVLHSNTSSGNAAAPEKTNKVDPTNKEQRKMWKDKAALARKKVDDLEKECQKLRSARDESSRKGLIFGTPNARNAAESLGKELETCEQNLKDAKKYLEEGLPEEARHAGVPPGWIR